MESAFRSFLTCCSLLLVLTLSVGAFAQVSKGSISELWLIPRRNRPGPGVKATNAETNQATTRLATVPTVQLLCCRSFLSGGDHKSGLPQSFPAGIGVTPGVDTGLENIKLEVGSISETVESLRDAADRDDAVPDHEHIRHQ